METRLEQEIQRIKASIIRHDDYLEAAKDYYTEYLIMTTEMLEPFIIVEGRKIHMSNLTFTDYMLWRKYNNELTTYEDVQIPALMQADIEQYAQYEEVA